MLSSTFPSLLAAILVTATGPAIAQTCSSDKSTDYQDPVVADGWTYRLVANDLRNPRGIEFDDDGHLLVIDRGEGIVRLQLDDEGGDCVSVKDKRTIVKDDNLNHGIAVSSDGKWLYASTVDEVYRWPYSSSSSSLDSRRTIVNNMTNSGHSTRTLLLPPSQPDILLVSRGSQGNDDPGARDIDSGRSQLRSFNLSSVSDDDDADPIDYINGDVLAWGLRNSVGVAEHPDGGIWSVENSVDNLERDGEDVHRDNPGEELNFHGFLNRSSDETGANYGYPMCVALWDTEGFPERGGMETGDQFATTDGDLDDDECRKDYMKPRLTFQAHSAPLDIKFNRNGSEAFVTFHGSWNREEPVGYKLVSVAFSSNGQPSADSESTSAATTILSNKDLSRCPDDCFRPVGLAWDKNGRLFMSSDSTGEIFVLQRNSSGGSSGGGNEGDSGSSSGGDDDDEDGVVGMQQFAPRSAAWAVSFAALVIGMLLA